MFNLHVHRVYARKHGIVVVMETLCWYHRYTTVTGTIRQQKAFNIITFN
jgi:hypothetical protein